MTYNKVTCKGGKTELKFPMGEDFVCNNAAMTAVSWDDEKYSLYTNYFKKN
jgi:hypothetical protein